jgi:uncharacterized protein YgiM (DUF1202 family)
MKKLIFLLTILPLLTAACITVRPVTIAPQSGTQTATASLPPTLIATDTPIALPATPPPAASATPLPIQGSLTIKVNVRSGPATSYASLGQLDAGEKIHITVKDA